MAQKSIYQVIITKPALVRYQEEVLHYILQFFSVERALEIDNNITETLESLMKMPERGAVERQLKNKGVNYRFLLFRQSRNLELKIVYYILEQDKKVYVTDFFPVLMNPNKVRGRSPFPLET